MLSTKSRAVIWGALAVILLIVLALPAHRNVKRPKARAQRISSVNNVRSVSMTLPATNTLPGAQPLGGK